jgi:glycosyltransferase involved in cell wall biosynthesis
VLQGEPLQSAVGRTPAAEAALAGLLAEQQYDAVHVEHVRAAFLHRSLPNGTPTLFDAVDCISLLWERTRRNSHSRVRRLIAAIELGATRRYERQLMSAFDRVTVTSPEDAVALCELNPRAPITVVPNGVDLDYFQPLGLASTPATLVFSGKMSYHANVTAVLHFVQNILPLVHKSVPDARLRIAGSNPPDVIRRLAANPQIEVTGHLPDLRQAVGTASVAICPVTVKVGIQNKILEAMAMAVPVVASSEGATGLQATAGKELLVGRDAAEIARHIVTLLTDEALRTRIASAGRQYVEREHRWSAAAGVLEDLYREAAVLHRQRQAT